MSYQKIYTTSHVLTGGECNAESRMPLTLMAARIIEIATFHANHLNVGFEHLAKSGLSWVLSRLSIEVVRYPEIGETYHIKTWVVNINRRFSERDFLITDDKGEAVAHARTIWVAINMETRTMGDLTGLTGLEEVASGEEAPMTPYPRLRPFDTNEAELFDTQFRYTDIDVNRHVNTVAYIRALLDTWPLDRYDREEIGRIDCAFIHEAYCGEKVTLMRRQLEDGFVDTQLTGSDERPVNRISLYWRERTDKKA